MSYSNPVFVGLLIGLLLIAVALGIYLFRAYKRGDMDDSLRGDD